mmetsp:Transcript_20632/g.44785  ORF Transcript_20632/g.44785 Transcript_20632/m.44785 type:complete len:97 (+) Transcript_20632:1365-1655(+)
MAELAKLSPMLRSIQNTKSLVDFERQGRFLLPPPRTMVRAALRCYHVDAGMRYCRPVVGILRGVACSEKSTVGDELRCDEECEPLRNPDICYIMKM